MDMLKNLRDEYLFVGLPDDNIDGGRRRTSRERSDSVFGTIHRVVGSRVLGVISYNDISSPITPPSFYEIEKSAGTKLIGMDSQGVLPQRLAKKRRSLPMDCQAVRL